MGKSEGIVVDAWFTGFAEDAEGKIYFCVYLGRTDSIDVSSSLAREIAIRLVTDYFFILNFPAFYTICTKISSYFCIRLRV